MKHIKSIALLILFFACGVAIIKIPIIIFWDKLLTLPTFQQLFGFLLFQGASCLCMFGLVYVFARKVDNVSLKSIYVSFDKRSIKLFLLGAFITGVAALGTWLAYIFFNHPSYQIKITSWYLIAAILMLNFAMGVFQAGLEELMFRSWALNKIGSLVGKYLAIIICGMAFGAIHLLNPSYTLFSALEMVIVGMTLAVAYFKAQSIWLPIGLHFGWNYFLGSVLYNRDIFRVTNANGDVVNLFNGGEKTWGGFIFSLLAFIAVIWLLRGKRARIRTWSNGLIAYFLS